MTQQDVVCRESKRGSVMDVFSECPVCGAFHHDVVCFARDRMHGLPGVFRYVRCRECGHVHLNPRPPADVISGYYPIDYGPHQATLPKQSILSWFLSPERRVQRFFRNIVTPDMKVLDVGCGRGDFLARLREIAHCSVYGVDFSPTAVSVARAMHGLDVFEGRLEEVPYSDGFFDVVSMWWYLEHDPSPVACLAACRRLLKPNGWLVVAVPNSASIPARVFRDKWFHLDAPRHMGIFCPESIRAIMRRTGFEICRVEYDRSTWGIIHSFEYFMRDRWGREGGFRRTFLARAICVPVTVLLAALRLSDNITVYARPAGRQ